MDATGLGTCCLMKSCSHMMALTHVSEFQPDFSRTNPFSCSWSEISLKTFLRPSLFHVLLMQKALFSLFYRWVFEGMFYFHYPFYSKCFEKLKRVGSSLGVVGFLSSCIHWKDKNQQRASIGMCFKHTC